MRKASMQEKNGTVLEYVLGLYFHVNHGFGVEDVKNYLDNPKVSDRSQLFKKELAQAIVNHSISPKEFERLTAVDYETQEEVDEFLKTEIWQPIYGNEPIKA